ncbi:hypothetical protein DFH28DRAFT_944452 [Melampsora americana]|nr:hypothetical protein DFH28DRAFT_944452 [Melampsora americana]
MEVDLSTPDFTLSNSYETLIDESLSNLTIDQKLLMAQAVHSVQPSGNVDHSFDWTRVVALLQKYASDSRLQFDSRAMVDPMACCDAYGTLCQKYLTEQSDLSQSESAFTLARRLYEVRLQGIGAALMAEEQKCKTLASEIEEIQGGAWDDRLKDPSQLRQILDEMGQVKIDDDEEDFSAQCIETNNGVMKPPQSRSTTPLDDEESGDIRPEAIVASPLLSELSRRSTRKSSPPKAFLQVPVTRKRKTRSESLSSSKTDSTTASKKKRTEPASPSVESPQEEITNVQQSPVRMLTRTKKKANTQLSSKKPTSSSKRRERRPSSALPSPDVDDEIVLQQLISERQSPTPSASTPRSRSHLGSGKPSQRKHGKKSKGIERSTELDPKDPPEVKKATSDLRSPDIDPHLIPDLTKETVSKDAKLKRNKQASQTPRAVATNSLGLENTDVERNQEDERGETTKSGSHSPVSVRKGQLEIEHQLDDSKAGTPNSVSFPTGITDGSSTAQQTPISSTIPIPQIDSSHSKAMTTSASSSTISDPTSFRRRMLKTHASVQSNPVSAVFREPVKDSEAPGYSHIIKRPMDLRALAKKLRDGNVTTAEEYRRDLMLMLANAVMFNHEGSEVTRHAKELLIECDRLVSIFTRGARY